MDRTIVRKTTLERLDEAFCMTLSPDDRLRVIENLNRIGRVMAGYPPSAPLNRSVVHTV